jgi:hypothetical protein
MAKKGDETIHVIRKPKVDKLKPASGPTEEFDVDDCFVIPRSSNETEGGWVQLSGYTVVAPGGTDVRADDQITVRGEVHSVIGKPGLYRKGRKSYLFITAARSA